ncbi:MAG: 6-phosphofructokinase [Planctomycetes bacterium]|nr:6-phosphofructokinase [Planctomycetota bacterium]
MSNTAKSAIKRVAMLFSGGPAPAANAVISTAAASFNHHGIEVLGMKNGYSNLVKFGPDRAMHNGRDFIVLDSNRLRRTRNTPGIMIGTARENPGKGVDTLGDLQNPQKCARLRTVYDALCSMEIDALISIGGDDTLRTANKMKLFQDTLPASSRKIPVVHVPKTIDNDYFGIDFTFGFFTAVETMAGEIRNLLADAEAGRAYFIVESMGRGAGWLAYAAAMAGEASHVMSIEDLDESMLTTEEVENKVTGQKETHKIMKLDLIVDRIVNLMRYRETEGKEFGVVVLAEGLASYYPLTLPASEEPPIEVEYDPFGHISSSSVDLGKRIAKRVAKRYAAVTGSKRKVNGVQLGYEVRCARPHAYDVILGSQLGVGAYRALVEEGKSGVMVSVEKQFDLKYVPFEELVDQATLTTHVRFIRRESDFYKLARFLETNVTEHPYSGPDRRH